MLDKLNLGSPPAVYVYAKDGKLAKRFDNAQANDASQEFTYKDVRNLVEELIQ